MQAVKVMKEKVAGIANVFRPRTPDERLSQIKLRISGAQAGLRRVEEQLVTAFAENADQDVARLQAEREQLLGEINRAMLDEPPAAEAVHRVKASQFFSSMEEEIEALRETFPRHMAEMERHARALQQAVMDFEVSEQAYLRLKHRHTERDNAHRQRGEPAPPPLFYHLDVMGLARRAGRFASQPLRFLSCAKAMAAAVVHLDAHRRQLEDQQEQSTMSSKRRPRLTAVAGKEG